MNTILSLQTIPQKKLIKVLYVFTLDDWKGGETLRTLLKGIAMVNYAVKTAFTSSVWLQLSKLIMNRFSVQIDIFQQKFYLTTVVLSAKGTGLRKRHALNYRNIHQSSC